VYIIQINHVDDVFYLSTRFRHSPEQSTRDPVDLKEVTSLAQFQLKIAPQQSHKIESKRLNTRNTCEEYMEMHMQRGSSIRSGIDSGRSSQVFVSHEHEALDFDQLIA
jgi:hypothetical protein